MFKIIGADQKEYGPVSSDQIRLWISEGRINAHTRVQAAGDPSWKTVAEFPEFAVLVSSSTPPPVPSIAMPPVQKPQTNQMALWAMITGIFSVACCCNCVGPVSLVLGIVALGQLKKNPGQTGSGFAIAGIVLGAIAIIMMIIGGFVQISNPELFSNLLKQMQQ